VSSHAAPQAPPLTMASTAKVSREEFRLSAALSARRPSPAETGRLRRRQICSPT
jgi:hypothetical protein